MKKTYEKPHIFYESFELSQSIAGSCEFISNFAMNICGYYDRELGITIFTSSISACVITNPNGNVCYHVPSDANNLFSS